MNDMARYIDADKLLEEVKRGGHALSEWSTLGVCCVIERQPTADVVPKSRADLYRKQVDELEDELASTYDKLENAKAEAAKEFTCFVGDPHKVEHCPYLDEIENAKTEYAGEIFEEIDKATGEWCCYLITTSKMAYLTSDVHKTLAELKKKYKEEKK